MESRLHIVFVCMGNICRSPTAHGVFRQKVQAAGLESRITFDSAATHNYHPGAAPDRRSQAHARARGYDLSDLRARHLRSTDFDLADLLLVMDDDNLHAVQHHCAPEHRHKLRHLTEFCRTQRSESVPDPYYGGPADFDRVLDLVEDACDGLLEHVRRELSRAGGS